MSEKDKDDLESKLASQDTPTWLSPAPFSAYQELQSGVETDPQNFAAGNKGKDISIPFSAILDQPEAKSPISVFLGMSDFQPEAMSPTGISTQVISDYKPETVSHTGISTQVTSDYPQRHKSSLQEYVVIREESFFDQPVSENERFRTICSAKLKQLAKEASSCRQQLEQYHEYFEHFKTYFDNEIKLVQEKYMTLSKIERCKELEQKLAEAEHRAATNLEPSVERELNTDNVQALSSQILDTQSDFHPANSKVIKQQERKYWKGIIHEQKEHYYLQRGPGQYEMYLFVDYQAEESTFVEEPFNLPGVEVTVRTTYLITNEDDTFHWTEYGFKLTVPPNSLPTGVDHCHLDIIASTAGEYQFPDNHHLVSGVFWVRPSTTDKFRQSLIMEIQHCAKITSSTKISFVRASCSQKTRPYTFKSVKTQYCSFSVHQGLVSVNHFSGHAVTIEGEDLASNRKYGASLYYLPRDREVPHCADIHFVVAWNTKANMKAIERRYLRKLRARSGPSLIVELEKDSVSLDTSLLTGIRVTNWELRSLIKTTTLYRSDIDSYSPDQTVPALQLEAIPQSEHGDSLRYELNLEGIKNSSEKSLVISIRLPTSRKISPNVIAQGFDIKDLNYIYELLIDASNKWFNLGLAMDIEYSTLVNIREKENSDEERLREMLAHQLQSVTSPLNFDIIITALKKRTVKCGNIASQIAEEQKSRQGRLSCIETL